MGTILKGIKNIIFDFGGVVIQLDYDLTRRAFEKLGCENIDKLYNQFRQKPVFDLYETGKISPEEFFNEISKLIPGNPSIPDLSDAWNAMLLDFPKQRLEFLKRIKSQYRTFLLSNTNESHLTYYFRKLKEWYNLESMDPLFEKTYYSCRLGMRKPDTEIFRYVLNDVGLIATETLFIDDSPQHVEGAARCGIRAHHLQKPETILDLLGG